MPNATALPAEIAELALQLRRRGVGDVLDSTTLARALYSSDASLYRVVPQAVARPRTSTSCSPCSTRPGGSAFRSPPAAPARRAPATPSDRGWSLDTSRHLTKIIYASTPTRGPPRSSPGVVQASLQAAAAPYGLRFGPDPSTHNRCTIGGMIGNNACGPRALGYGRTADNVVALDVITGARRAAATRRFHRQPTRRRPCARCGRWSRATSATIRTEFGRFGRQVSGYSLEHLLPENGFDVRPLPGRHRGHAGGDHRCDRAAGRRRRRSRSCSPSATRPWPTPPTRRR